MSRATQLIASVMDAVDVLAVLDSLELEPALKLGQEVIYRQGPLERHAVVLAVLDLPWGRQYEVGYESAFAPEGPGGLAVSRCPRSHLTPVA